MTLYKWSQTSASNATADSTINWAEGQAPSSVNDSARAMMTAVSKYRDDIAGAIATGGTSTAYTITSYEVFDTLAHMNGQMIAFTPHTTNAATVTLNVDGLGAKPLRTSPSVELLAGTLVQGTPYVATYSNSDAAWYLQNFYGNNPYYIPLGGFLPYAGASAPNSSFVLPYGQAISRTTYATLFSLIGSTYGAGDASTTFNVPDLRGRGIFFKDNMGGSAANRITVGASGIDAVNLSASGGAETHTLTQAEMPAHFHSASISDPGHTHTYNQGAAGPQKPNSGGTAPFDSNTTATTGSSFTGIRLNSANGLDTTNTAGSGSAHAIMPPAYILNCIMRVI